jgi:hypothetical protein
MMQSPAPNTKLASSADEDEAKGWVRTAVLLCALWVLAVCAVAIYEGVTVDPWKFIGENRGPIFYSWSRQVASGSSSFGEIALVFDTLRFWVALLAPIVAVIAFSALVPVLTRLIRQGVKQR